MELSRRIPRIGSGPSPTAQKVQTPSGEALEDSVRPSQRTPGTRFRAGPDGPARSLFRAGCGLFTVSMSRDGTVRTEDRSADSMRRIAEARPVRLARGWA